MYNSLVNVPKTKRGEKTLNKIIKSAEMNFLEQGYYNTSIINITQGAGIGLGTFYVYFEDKMSVYKYLLLQYSHQIRKQIAIAIDGLTDRKEIERVGLKTYLEYIKENPHIYNIIWESLYIDKTLFQHYYVTFSDFYVKALNQSKDDNEIKDFDTEVVSYMLMGISNFIGLRWIMFEDIDDFDPIVDEVIDILDKGLFTK